MRTCTFPDCERPHWALDLCKGHWTQQSRGQILRPLRSLAPVYCHIDGCKQLASIKSRALCHSHYERWRRGTLHLVGARACQVCRQSFVPVRNMTARFCSDRCSHRAANWRVLYGLEANEWHRLNDAQDSRCAICHRADDLHVDHCHETGRIRGLLCAPCNQALGLLQDDPIRCMAAIGYLGASHVQVS